MDIPPPPSPLPPINTRRAQRTFRGRGKQFITCITIINIYLGYNLNFVPTPEHFNFANFKKDLNQFERHVKLRSHFGLYIKDTIERKLHNTNKTWMPKDIHQTVSTFLEYFNNTIGTKLSENNQKLNQTGKVSTEGIK